MGKQNVVLGEVYTYHIVEQPSPHPFPKTFISPNSILVCVCVCVCTSPSVVYDSLRSHGL